MTNDAHGCWLDRLSEYVDGDLDAAERAACEIHLGECGGCRTALEELRAVVHAARNVTDVEPPRDLWQGIAAAIRAPIDGARESHGQVIPLPVDGRATRIEYPGSTRATQVAATGVTLSRPQLAAAAAIRAEGAAVPGSGA